MADVNSRNQRGYVQLESNYGVIPNSTGAATVANSNCFQFISLVMNPSQPVNQRPDKNGSLSRTVGIAGRRTAGGSMRCSLAGSGAAGSAPDIGPFLQALLGKVPVVTPSTSVAYGVDDNQYGLSIYSFWTPSTAVQECAFGSVITRGRFSGGGDFGEAEFDFSSRWVIGTDEFGSAPTAAKGGLSAFPSEPGSPATNGLPMPGFTGSATLDSTAYDSLRTFSIDITPNRDLPADVFNSYYSGLPGQDQRDVRVSWSMYDSDASSLNTLKGKAKSQTAVTLVFVLGSVAGNIWTFTLNNVLLDAAQSDDSGRKKVVNFSGTAHASSGTAKNEFSLVIT